MAVFALCIYSIIPTWQVHSQSKETKEEFIRANPKVANKAINFGLDLAGGSHVVVEMETSDLKPEEKEKSLTVFSITANTTLAFREITQRTATDSAKTATTTKSMLTDDKLLHH